MDSVGAKAIRDFFVTAVAEHDFKAIHDHKAMITAVLDEAVKAAEFKELENRLLVRVSNVISGSERVANLIYDVEKTLSLLLTSQKEFPNPVYPPAAGSRPKPDPYGPNSCASSCAEGCGAIADCQQGPEEDPCAGCNMREDCPDGGPGWGPSWDDPNGYTEDEESEDRSCMMEDMKDTGHESCYASEDGPMSNPSTPESTKNKRWVDGRWEERY